MIIALLIQCMLLYKQSHLMYFLPGGWKLRSVVANVGSSRICASLSPHSGHTPGSQPHATRADAETLSHIGAEGHPTVPTPYLGSNCMTLNAMLYYATTL